MSNSHAAQVEEILSTARTLRSELGTDSHEQLMEAVYATAAHIADRAVTQPGETARPTLDRTIDRLVTSRIWGFPLMFLLFALMFWLTISGANVPSGWLAWLLVDTLYPMLREGAAGLGLPWWLWGLLIDGMYLSTAWVVSVMLPPMAIFFPLFTLLEDFGYLPAGCLQPGLALQEGGRPRQAGHDDHDGVRLQCGGSHRHADHRQPARTADRHPHQQLRSVQRSLADADPHRHAVHRHSGARRAGRRGLGARRGGRRGPGGRPDLRDRVGALPDRPPGPGLDVQSRTAPVSSAADPADALHVDHRSDDPRALARRGVGVAGRRPDLAHGEHPHRRAEHRGASGRLCSIRSDCSSA